MWKFCLASRNRRVEFFMQLREIWKYQNVEVFRRLFLFAWYRFMQLKACCYCWKAVPKLNIHLRNKIFPMIEIFSDSILTWKQVRSRPASAKHPPPPCRSDPSRSNPFQRSASSAISEVTWGQKKSTESQVTSHITEQWQLFLSLHNKLSGFYSWGAKISDLFLHIIDDQQWGGCWFAGCPRVIKTVQVFGEEVALVSVVYPVMRTSCETKTFHLNWQQTFLVQLVVAPCCI